MIKMYVSIPGSSLLFFYHLFSQTSRRVRLCRSCNNRKYLGSSLWSRSIWPLLVFLTPTCASRPSLPFRAALFSITSTASGLFGFFLNFSNSCGALVSAFHNRLQTRKIFRDVTGLHCSLERIRIRIEVQGKNHLCGRDTCGSAAALWSAGARVESRRQQCFFFLRLFLFCVNCLLILFFCLYFFCPVP